MGNETMITERANRFHWHTAIFVGLFHLGAVAALFMFDWKALVVAIALWWDFREPGRWDGLPPTIDAS